MGLITKLMFTIAKGKAERTFPAPLVFNDILYYDITSVDWTATGGYLDTGIFFKGDTAGYYTCVTYAQYLLNGGDIAADASAKAAAIAKAISDGDTAKIYLAAYQWTDVNIVFIDATSAASTNLNLGIF